MKYINNTYNNKGNVTETYVEETGKATFSLCYYDKIPSDIWLYSLSVDAKERGKGIGNKTLDYAIEEAKEIATDGGLLRLSAETGSWVEKWYERRGWVKYHTEDNRDWLVLHI